MQETSVGVIVARFQVPALHEGHWSLIKHVLKRHTQVLIVLGSTGGVPNEHDFLPYEMRKEMVLESFPTVSVVELKDHPISTEAWSAELDAIVASLFPGKAAVGYSGANGFIKEYSGTITTVTVPDIDVKSGTHIRKTVKIPNTFEVRLGMLQAQRLRPSHVFPTGDLAILSKSLSHVVLIGRKRELGALRFPGGFAEKRDQSYGATSIREGSEEVPGVVVQNPQYIGSTKVEDHRYRYSEDSIMTSFHAAMWISGHPKAGDDADHATWASIEHLESLLVPAHQPLGRMLQGYVRSLTVA